MSFEYVYSDSTYPTAATAAGASNYYAPVGYQSQYMPQSQPYEQGYQANGTQGYAECGAEQYPAASRGAAVGLYASHYDRECHSGYEVSSAQGVAGYPYDVHTATIPAAPPEPYTTESSEGGYGSAAQNPTPYTAAAAVQGFAQTIPPNHSHFLAPTAQYGYMDHSRQYQYQQYASTSTFSPARSYPSPTYSQGAASGSSLADALRSPIIVARRGLPEPEPEYEPDVETTSVMSGTPDPVEHHLHGQSDDMGYTFVLENGPGPARGGSSGGSRAPATGVPTIPPRKKRSPPKGPRKEQGFLACYFCRGRKIACNVPPPGSNSATCEQCAKRHLSCEFPTESRRGQRGLGGPGRKNLKGVTRRMRHEVHLSMMPKRTEASATALSSSSPASTSAPEHDLGS